MSDDASLDQAIGEFIDEDGLFWLHAYFVWPHLTVHATVSGPEGQVRDTDNWALKSLKEIAINVQ